MPQASQASQDAGDTLGRLEREAERLKITVAGLLGDDCDSRHVRAFAGALTVQCVGGVGGGG